MLKFLHQFREPIYGFLNTAARPGLASGAAGGGERENALFIMPENECKSGRALFFSRSSGNAEDEDVICVILHPRRFIPGLYTGKCARVLLREKCPLPVSRVRVCITLLKTGLFGKKEKKNPLDLLAFFLLVWPNLFPSSLLGRLAGRCKFALLKACALSTGNISRQFIDLLPAPHTHPCRGA